MGDGSVFWKAKSHRATQVLVIQKLSAENMIRRILLSASLTVSTPDAICRTATVYTGHDKATIVNHFSLVSVRQRQNKASVYCRDLSCRAASSVNSVPD